MSNHKSANPVAPSDEWATAMVRVIESDLRRGDRGTAALRLQLAYELGVGAGIARAHAATIAAIPAEAHGDDHTPLPPKIEDHHAADQD